LSSQTNFIDREVSEMSIIFPSMHRVISEVKLVMKLHNTEKFQMIIILEKLLTRSCPDGDGIGDIGVVNVGDVQ